MRTGSWSQLVGEPKLPAERISSRFWTELVLSAKRRSRVQRAYTPPAHHVSTRVHGVYVRGAGRTSHDDGVLEDLDEEVQLLHVVHDVLDRA